MPIKNSKELLEQWKKHKSISESSLQDQQTQAKKNYAFYAGDAMSYNASVLDKGRRISVIFNKIKPYVDSIAGTMVQLRRKPGYIARMADNGQQQAYSSSMNALSDYARDNGNFDQLETRQDKHMLIVGYGAVDTNIIFHVNPDGEIKGENISPFDVFWDPQARESNLLDSRWVFRRKKFSRDEAEKRFPKVDPLDFESAKETLSDYIYNPVGGTYDKIAIGSEGQEEDLVQVYYYQYWELQTYYRAFNPLSEEAPEVVDPSLVFQVSDLMRKIRERRIDEGIDKFTDDYFEFDPLAEFLVMTPQIKNDMDALFKKFGIDVEYQVHEKQVYYTAIITGDEIIKKFKSPHQQGFTIKFKTGDFDEQNERWLSMVDSLREPSKYANKALTEMLYVIASNSKGGVLYEKGAVDNSARFEQQYASTKGAIQVNDGAVSGGKITPKAQAALPTGYEHIYNISNQSLAEVTGINREFLGMSEAKQVSALLESQRINQVINTLAGPFDSITLYQKEHARLMLTWLKQLSQNSQGRLVKLIGEDGAARFEAISEDQLASEYDVQIAELPASVAQKQETTQVMLGMADKLAVLGINIYASVVPYLPIKQEDKTKLIQTLQPQPPDPEQVRQQQALQQLTMQGQLAQIAKDKSDTFLKESQAQKIAASIPGEAIDQDKTQAEVIKTLEEAQQKSLENDAIKSGVNKVDLII